MEKLNFFRKALALGWWILVATSVLVPSARAWSDEFTVPVMGESKLVFDSNPDYINDHTVVRGPDGKWHLIGITHKKVLAGRLPVPWAEEEFIHAAAPSLSGPWTRLPPVLQIDQKLGETHVWAPFITPFQDQYYCFYAGGGGHWDSMINLALSPDLMTWTRSPANPLFRDFYDARDPMVLKVGEQWVIYYTKTFSRQEPFSTVAYRVSSDLVHWSDANFALVIKYLKPTIPNSQYTESPFVVHAGGKYYLFICTPDLNYRATLVFVSDDPFHFDEKNEVATLVAHCAEVVEDAGRYFVTHAGWFYDGLYLAPLSFKPARLFSPSMRFANAGDTNDYLVSAGEARNVKWGFAGQRALRLRPGQELAYRFPLPEGATGISLVFEKAGHGQVRVGDQVVYEDKAAAGKAAELHALEIAAPAVGSQGEFQVRFKAAGKNLSDSLEVSYLKIYYR